MPAITVPVVMPATPSRMAEPPRKMSAMTEKFIITERTGWMTAIRR